MTAVNGFLKPCYVFAPRVLLRRIGLALAPAPEERCVVEVPWGAMLRVNVRETIGRELYQQKVFDIAVSETAWRLLEPGDAVVDVGANIGYMTSLFAARVGTSGRVDAFEPHPRIFAELERNVAELQTRKDVAPVHLHACALGSRNGAARLVEPEMFGSNEGTATLVRRADAAATNSVSVPVARLDTLLDRTRIALLKVDVEGFEHAVLTGAERLFAGGYVENVIYEAHDLERSPLHGWLQRSGFCVFGIGHGLSGLKIKAGTGAPQIDPAWESPSYLATLHPERVLPRLRGSGWRVLSAKR